VVELIDKVAVAVPPDVSALLGAVTAQVAG